MKYFLTLKELALAICETVILETEYFYRKDISYQGYIVCKLTEATMDEVENSIRNFPLEGEYRDSIVSCMVIGNYKSNDFYPVFCSLWNRPYLPKKMPENAAICPYENTFVPPPDKTNMYVLVEDDINHYSDNMYTANWGDLSISVSHKLFEDGYMSVIYVSGRAYLEYESFEIGDTIKTRYDEVPDLDSD